MYTQLLQAGAPSNMDPQLVGDENCQQSINNYTVASTSQQKQMCNIIQGSSSAAPLTILARQNIDNESPHIENGPEVSFSPLPGHPVNVCQGSYLGTIVSGIFGGQPCHYSNTKCGSYTFMNVPCELPTVNS